jgi:cob(I)alamin adenosyltransferase
MEKRGMKFSKRGDGGETSLLGGQRVPKYDIRTETYGTLDEASSVLGVARAMTSNQKIKDILLVFQKDLLIIGAELSALPEDIGKLGKRIDEVDVRKLEEIIDNLQENVQLKNEFIHPGDHLVGAQIDVGRTIIRRSERWATKLKYEGAINRPEIHQYLNRLADMLFTLARYAEQND